MLWSTIRISLLQINLICLKVALFKGLGIQIMHQNNIKEFVIFLLQCKIAPFPEIFLWSASFRNMISLYYLTFQNNIAFWMQTCTTIIFQHILSTLYFASSADFNFNQLDLLGFLWRWGPGGNAKAFPAPSLAEPLAWFEPVFKNMPPEVTSGDVIMSCTRSMVLNIILRNWQSDNSRK